MGCLSDENLLAAKRFCSFACGGVLITVGVLAVLGCFVSMLWITPIGAPAITAHGRRVWRAYRLWSAPCRMGIDRLRVLEYRVRCPDDLHAARLGQEDNHQACWCALHRCHCVCSTLRAKATLPVGKSVCACPRLHDACAVCAGFLDAKLGRAMFYLYCGCATAGAANAKDANAILIVFSYVNWGMCWFVGLFELCGPKDEKHASLPAEVAPQNVHGSYSAPQDPSLSINITPAQAGAAVHWASRNTGTVAAVASAAANASSTNPRSDNPFFAQNRA